MEIIPKLNTKLAIHGTKVEETLFPENINGSGGSPRQISCKRNIVPDYFPYCKKIIITYKICVLDRPSYIHGGYEQDTSSSHPTLNR